MIENHFRSSVHSLTTPQPAARSSKRLSRRPYLWLFSVWIVSPAFIEKPTPATVNSTSRTASRCISIRLISSFQIARWRKAATSIVAVQLGIDAVEEVEVEARR